MTTLDPEEGGAAVADAREAVLAEAAAAVDPLEQRVDMAPLDIPRRLLLVHAHPDDESISCGITMAHYAARGDLVTLVTCTLGEEGEIVVPELAHLAADRDDALGPHRVAELAAACEALGVRDHRFLGGAGRWRDSGMMGEPTNDNPACFWQADLAEATRELVAVIREVRPQVVITYDANGGYGHPDHIQAHRVSLAAVDAAGDPGAFAEVGEPWQVAKVYYTAIPRSVMQAGLDALREQGIEAFGGVASAEDMGTFVVRDADVAAVVDAPEQLEAKLAALRAHRSQISVDGPFFALSNHLGQRAFAREFFVLARGERGAAGVAGDLFDGVGG